MKSRVFEHSTMSTDYKWPKHFCHTESICLKQKHTHHHHRLVSGPLDMHSPVHFHTISFSWHQLYSWQQQSSEPSKHRPLQLTNEWMVSRRSNSTINIQHLSNLAAFRLSHFVLNNKFMAKRVRKCSCLHFVCLVFVFWISFHCSVVWSIFYSSLALVGLVRAVRCVAL